MARALAKNTVELETLRVHLARRTLSGRRAALLSAARPDEVKRHRLELSRWDADERALRGGAHLRAHAAEDADVALELRDGLVHLAAQLLGSAPACRERLQIELARCNRRLERRLVMPQLALRGRQGRTSGLELGLLSA